MMLVLSMQAPCNRLTIKCPHTKKNKTYVRLAGMRMDFLWASFQPTRAPDSSENFKDCRTVSGTASKWWNNLETQQPMLWSDEYLPTGGMLIPSVLSQQAHMVPCCSRLQQERLFSRGCLQFIYTVSCTCCVAMRCQTKATSCQNCGGVFCFFFCLLWSRFVTLWYPHCVVCSSHSDTDNMFPMQRILNLLHQWLLSSPPVLHTGKKSCWAYVSYSTSFA